MASTDITKPTAAQRQIDAAIRMLFSGEDVLAVHTVAAAANRIVLDLRGQRSETRGQGPYVEYVREGMATLYQEQLGMSPPDAIIQRVLPQFEKWFRNRLNRPANFLKHADRDAGESLDQNSLQTDLLLLSSCSEYANLGFALTLEMKVFCRWHLAAYPHQATDPIKTGAGYVHDLSRSHQLEAGNFLLSLYRDQQRSVREDQDQ